MHANQIKNYKRKIYYKVQTFNTKLIFSKALKQCTKKAKVKNHILSAKSVKMSSEFKCNKYLLKQITKTIKNQIHSMSAVYAIIDLVFSHFCNNQQILKLLNRAINVPVQFHVFLYKFYVR